MKLFNKLAIAAVGAVMALGVGIGLHSNSNSVPVNADTNGTLVLNRSCFKAGSLAYNVADDWTAVATTGETITGQGDLYSAANTTYLQTKNSGVATHYHNTKAMPGYISGISMKLNSGTNRNYTVRASKTDAITSTSGGTEIGTMSAGTKFTNNLTKENDYRYFWLTCTGGSSMLDNITIEYCVVDSGPEDAALDLLYFDTNPSKKTYYSDSTNEDIDMSGAVVKAHYASVSQPSWNSDGSKDKEVKISNWTIDMSALKITGSYTEGSVTKTIEWVIINNGQTKPLTVTYEPSKCGYSNEQAPGSWTNDVISIAFDKGSSSNTTKWFNSGTALRAYAGNKITISSETKNITGVIFNLAASGSTAGLYIANGSEALDNNSWNGSAPSVVFTISGGTSGNMRIASIQVLYANKTIVIPNDVRVTVNSGKDTLYNGAYSTTYKLLTSDLVVSTVNGSDISDTYSNGTGFIVTINGVTKDATSSVQEFTFTGVAAGTYEITVVVKGAGEGGADLTNSTKPTITVVNEDTSEVTWNNEQTGTFYSYVDKLHIDGTINAKFNSGRTGISSESITTNVYASETANDAFLIYSKSKSYNTHKDGFDISSDDLLEGKSFGFDTNGIISVTAETKIYVEMFVTNCQAAKIGKVVTIKTPTLQVSDANTATYYVGNTYEMNAYANLVDASSNTLKKLYTSEYTITPASFTPTSTDAATITVTFNANTNITATYTVTALEPAALDTIELYDNTGASLGDDGFVIFVAGEKFHLFNKENCEYFAYVLDTNFDEYNIDSYNDFSFELLDEYDSTSGRVITNDTYMLKSMDLKYVKATYSQGTSNVSFTYQIAIDDATVEEYTPSVLGDYTKVTSLNGVTTGNYLIVAKGKAFVPQDAEGNYTTVSISNNTIAYSKELEKISFDITKTDAGIYAQVNENAENNAGKYFGGTSGSNVLNFKDEKQLINLTSADNPNRISAGGNFDLVSNSTYLSYNTNNAGNGGDRFRFYKSGTSTNSGYLAVELYKRTGTEGKGDAISFLKSVIDTYRLNNEENGMLSICNGQTAIYSQADWTKAKEVYSSLTDASKDLLKIQDTFGEAGKTYYDTYEMLLSKEPKTSGSNFLSNDNGQSGAVVSLVAILGLTTLGGAFFFKKRKIA